jgi:membrane protease YdiL (CAAX protease family)
LTKHSAATIVLAAAAFLLAVAVPALLRTTPLVSFMTEQTWLPHFLVKTSLVVLALAFMLAVGGDRRTWGFSRPRTLDLPAIAAAAVVGAATTGLIILTPAEGMRWIMRDLGLAGLVVWIWFYSSVTEEVFVRGWFQSALARGGMTRGGRVAASALFFGAMHLSLLLTDTDGLTVAIIVAATTLLGVVVAISRERSGSVVPPILAHAAFNVGAALGGIVTTVTIHGITGRFPEQ